MITSKSVARSTVEMYRWMEANIDKAEDRVAVESFIVDSKRLVRDYFSRVPDDGVTESSVLSQDVDRLLAKEVLPAYVVSMEDALQWWDCYRRREFKNSAYDCTGSWETWISGIMKRESDGRYVIFTKWLMDV